MLPINLLRANGRTVALSVTAAAHASVAVVANDESQPGFAAFLNTGATTVAITLAPKGMAAAVPAFPTDGSPTATIILPPGMTQPLTLPMPGASFSVAAIGSAAGPSLVYITPMSV
jgi:hypothetical protein